MIATTNSSYLKTPTTRCTTASNLHWCTYFILWKYRQHYMHMFKISHPSTRM